MGQHAIEAAVPREGRVRRLVRLLGCVECAEPRPRGPTRWTSGRSRTHRHVNLVVVTTGVECRKDSGVVDEIPGAYKPIEKVIDQQRDLVQVVAKLKQVILYPLLDTR